MVDKITVVALVVVDDQQHGFVRFLCRIKHGMGLGPGFLHGHMVAGFLGPPSDPGFVFGHQSTHGSDESGFGFVIARRLLHVFLDGVQPFLEAFTGPSRVRRPNHVLAFHAFPEGFDPLERSTCFVLVGISLGFEGRNRRAELVPLALGVRGEALGRLQFLASCVELVRDDFSKALAAMKHQTGQEVRLDFEQGVDVHAPGGHTHPCKGSPAAHHGVKVKNPAAAHEPWVGVVGAGSCLLLC
ncbi:MAG: hypothetical protein DWC11_06300 [Candidatus Poseidoniales archaeon]|nr:MAG: hypothetical protein DWC11_06300 [Candidatus Poseidoniales archaeon]